MKKKPTTKAGKQRKVAKVMGEFAMGELHSGAGGPVVRNPKQAKAIAMSEAGIKPKGGRRGRKRR